MWNEIILGTACLLNIFPYLFYTYIYKYPRHYLRHFSQKFLIKWFTYIKVVSTLLHIPACMHAGVNKAGVALGYPLIFFGQYLSELVYAFLGDEGVYYGVELQTVKPKRIVGFPFNMGDPQYKGCILTCLGWYMMVNPTVETTLLMLSWAFAYFYIIVVENTKGGVDNIKQE